MDATQCAKCGAAFDATRVHVDGRQYHFACIVSSRISRIESALREIAYGHVDDGGNVRNHPEATQIARSALKQL